MNNKENEYFFAPEGGSQFQYEDIVSSSAQNREFEEIYSLSSFAGRGKFKKRKRGIAKWWSSLKTGYKALIITSVSLVTAAAVAIGVLASVFDYNYREIETDDLGFENVIDKNIVNVALFGIDTRDTESFEGNSDSIMILSLNTVTKKVKIISVMRDTLVPITYNGKTTYSKINSAYARGGPELAIKTLNEIFELDISEYATVNFFGMVDIIDAVGGIDAELTEGEVQPKSVFRFGLNGCISEICSQLGVSASDNYITEAGKHHLNGIQAVAYSRIRKVSNIWGTTDDYGRTDRQRYVMEQLFNKAITLEKKNYVKLAKSLIPCSETSLSYTEIMGLAFDILLKSPTFEQARVPTEEYLMTSPNTSAGSVVYFDLDFAAKIIHAFIYDDITPENYIEINGVEMNDWYREEVGYYTPSYGSDDDDDDDVTYEPSESSEPDDTVPSQPEDTSDGQSGGDADPSSSDTSSDDEEPDESNPDESNPSDPGGDGNTSSNVPDESQPPDTSVPSSIPSEGTSVPSDTSGSGTTRNNTAKP